MEPVIVEVLLDASVDKVWMALTDKDEMKKWYFDLPAFKPEVGFEFEFLGQGANGESYKHLCKVTAVAPNKRLQYCWCYENLEGYSLVTFDLAVEGSKTRVKLTHSGLETLPQDNPDFKEESFKGGWTQLLTKFLVEHLRK